MTSRRLVIVTRPLMMFLCLGVFLISPVQAEQGLSSKWADVIPRIDGIVDQQEWQDSNTVLVEFAGGLTPTTSMSCYISLKNDNEYLYIGLDGIGDVLTAANAPTLWVNLRPDSIQYGYVARYVEFSEMYIYSDTGTNVPWTKSALPTAFLGAKEFVANWRSASSHWMFEYRLPLAQLGGTIGVRSGDTISIQFNIGVRQAPGASYYVYPVVAVQGWYTSYPYAPQSYSAVSLSARNVTSTSTTLPATISTTPVQTASRVATSQQTKTSREASTSQQTHMAQQVSGFSSDFLSGAVLGIALVIITAMIGFFLVSRSRSRRHISIARKGPGSLFEVSVSVPSVGKTVNLEVAPDHTVGSLVESVASTLNLPKGTAYAVMCGGRFISQGEFGETLGALGIKEGSKLSLIVLS